MIHVVMSSMDFRLMDVKVSHAYHLNYVLQLGRFKGYVKKKLKFLILEFSEIFYLRMTMAWKICFFFQVSQNLVFTKSTLRTPLKIRGKKVQIHLKLILFPKKLQHFAWIR